MLPTDVSPAPRTGPVTQQISHVHLLSIKPGVRRQKILGFEVPRDPEAGSFSGICCVASQYLELGQETEQGVEAAGLILAAPPLSLGIWGWGPGTVSP